MKMIKRWLVWALSSLIVVVILFTAAEVLVAQRGLDTGRELMAFELWPQAREKLKNYLWLHPRDGEAQFLMAESYAKDESLPAAEAAAAAIQQLTRISDTHPRAGEARLRQGQLEFLILHRPIHAERSVRQALELGVDELPAQQMLWTLYNATGRGELAEEIFWRLYELSPEGDRPERLREWYLSLFFPATACAELDRQMGILGPDEEPTRTTESRRYLRFRESEPQSLINHAALARWCQLEGDLDFAVRLIDAAIQNKNLATDAAALPTNPTTQPTSQNRSDLEPAETASPKTVPATASDHLSDSLLVAESDDAIRGSSNPFYLSTAIGIFLDLGQFDRAKGLFDQWPHADRGHFYWRSRALILDEVLRDHEQALTAYEQALTRWPGPADWRLQFRKAGCLTRLRRTDEADRVREQARQVQSLMVPEAHERLWKALHQVPTPEQLEPLVLFYQTLGRTRETDAWKQIVASLPRQPASQSQPVNPSQHPSQQPSQQRLVTIQPPFLDR